MSWSVEELLIARIAERLVTLNHVAVGASSPIPGAAALLAREQSHGRLRVSILGSTRHSQFTDGSRELFDCAGQGRIDAFFLGGAQIDQGADINLVAIGGYPKPKVRFPGSFGSSYLYFVIPNVFLFTLNHSRRVLVPKVDFVSAPGTSPANVYRPGGPKALFTNRSIFAFDAKRKRFTLMHYHHGESIESVIEHTGFDFDLAADVSVTPTPDATTLALIRGSVADDIAQIYPAFAQRVFATRASAN